MDTNGTLISEDGEIYSKRHGQERHELHESTRIQSARTPAIRPLSGDRNRGLLSHSCFFVSIRGSNELFRFRRTLIPDAASFWTIVIASPAEPGVAIQPDLRWIASVAAPLAMTIQKQRAAGMRSHAKPPSAKFAPHPPSQICSKCS